MDYIDEAQEYESEQVQGRYSPDVSIAQARLNSKFTKRFGDNTVTPEQVAAEMQYTIEHCTKIEVMR